MLEATAAKILPPGYRVDYTGESRQLRQEAGKFLPAMGLAMLLIFLVLAAQFNSFRDPFVILAGSVPLAMFGALIFTFLKFAGPPGHDASPSPRAGPRRSTSTRRSAWSRWSGLIAKNGILIVQFANDQQLAGMSQDRRRAARRRAPACARS